MFIDRETQLVQMTVLPKLTNRLTLCLSKLQQDFVDTENYSKMHIERQRKYCRINNF